MATPGWPELLLLLFVLLLAAFNAPCVGHRMTNHRRMHNNDLAQNFLWWSFAERVRINVTTEEP